MLKAVLSKTSVAVVGGMLVVPFVVAAVLVGARAVAGANATAKQSLAMFALALAWTTLGGVKGFARTPRGGRQGHEPSAARSSAGARRQPSLGTRGL